MGAICQADCGKCADRDTCRGCSETCGSPFGGRCPAAEYIRVGGMEAYRQFKKGLLSEINRLLRELDLPAAETLCELKGEYINLEYRLPNGTAVKLLNDRDIYFGTQIPFADCGVCYGVAANAGFILICSYSVDGSNPELILYRKR